MKQISDVVFAQVRDAMVIAKNFCGSCTAEDCPDTVAIPINQALVALDTAQPVQVNAMLVEALERMVESVTGVDQVSAVNEARAALTAAKQAQPERAPLSADAYEALVDDLGEWSRHVVEDTAHITLDTHIRRTLAVHGIKQGGQHD